MPPYYNTPSSLMNYGSVRNIYIQNNYGSGSYGRSWLGSSSNYVIPVRMEPRYYTTYSNYSCSCLPSWAQKALDGSMVYSILKDVFGGSA